MGAFSHIMLVSALGLLSAAVAATAQQANPAFGAAPAAKQPAAPALPPMTNRAPAMRQAGWVQREGYVPVPQSLLKPETPAGPDPNALPAANQWATVDEKPFANDPTGTNVFSDTKYAPAAVRAAFENQNDEPPLDPTTSVFAAAKPNPAGPMAGPMAGGMAAAGMAPGQGAMLAQSFGPDSPVGAAGPSGDVLVGGNSAGAGGDVFTGGNNAFNNRYTPSVGNAMGSSDTLVSMVVEAPEQQTALASDAIRSIMGRLVNVYPNRIFVYQTRTINNPQGQPSTAVTYIIKNQVDAERSRQQSTFGSADIMNGFTADVAKATKLRITPSTIKVSSAVNDGGMGAGAMPGQMPGGSMLGGPAMPGQMMPGGGMMATAPQGGMPGAAATTTPAAPAPPAKSSANGSTAGVLTVAAVLLAAVIVF